MFRNLIITTAATAFIIAVTAFGSGKATVGEAAGEHTVRIGTYDNRAIAIAYANSSYLPVGEWKKEHKQAKENGDEKRVKELEHRGESHQAQLHFQGFCRVPVTDLLEHVADRLPEVAKEHNLDAIAFDCNFTGPGVEEVDITLALVKLFDPSPEAFETVAEIKKHDPVALVEMQANHDH